MNVEQLRQVVLDKMARGKISPNAKELTAYKNALPSLSPQLMLVAIGLMLGDVSLQANASGTGYRIKFEWGDINKAYALHVYDLFKLYCLSEPRKQVRVNKNGNAVTTWCFQTVMHTAFAPLVPMFFTPGDSGKLGRKTINATLLMQAFGPESLAFWFMDDGGLISYKPNRYGIQLHTQGFTKEEVQSLVRLLQDKYGLQCWLKLNKGRWTIAISGNSYVQFFDLVKPFIHDSMKHKLPKGNRTQF